MARADIDKVGAAYAVKRCFGGWYWGKVDVELTARKDEAMLEDRAGPFGTAGEAALDMVRTWIEGSVKMGRSN